MFPGGTFSALAFGAGAFVTDTYCKVIEHFISVTHGLFDVLQNAARV
jgi:hypothetical protein